jgi:hypothetical protein
MEMARHESALSPEGIEGFVEAVAELAVEWLTRTPGCGAPTVDAPGRSNS